MTPRTLTESKGVVLQLLLNMNEEKDITINDLARLMQDEFLGVNRRLDGHDKCFDGIDKRFDGIEKRLDGHDKRFDGIEKRLDVLETDVKFIKDNASELFAKLDEFISLYRDAKQELSLLAKQMGRLEERVAQLEGRR
jgi:archaellum component FlaC